MNKDLEFLETAVRAARLAGEVISSHLGRAKEIDMKQASDFVTDIDRRSEELIISTIKESFPTHSFLAEESLKEEAIGYRWIIDPLDGTTNFIHTYPVFSVSIALEHMGEVILGVIYDPMRNELFSAEIGRGASLNGLPVKVSQVARMRDALITTGFPFRGKKIIDDYLRLFKSVFLRVSDLRRAGSAALDLAYLASGRCDGFFEAGLGPWDIAAGALIIREAGGMITDFDGGPGYLSTGNIVAGNPAIHGELLAEVKKVFPINHT